MRLSVARSRTFLGGLALALSILVAGHTTLAAADPEGAQKFIADMAAQAVTVLKSTEPGSPQREQGLAPILRQNFDLPYLAQLALGRTWRDLSPADRQRLVDAFADWVVKTQSRRLGQYAGEQFQVTGAKSAGGDDTMVATQISAGRLTQPVNVGWRVRGSGTRFQVIDVVIEGVSMVVTYRSEFAPIVERGGVQALISEIEKRANGAASAEANG